MYAYASSCLLSVTSANGTSVIFGFRMKRGKDGLLSRTARKTVVSLLAIDTIHSELRSGPFYSECFRDPTEATAVRFLLLRQEHKTWKASV